MIKFILLLIISFTHALSYDDEDKYTKLYGWSINAGYTAFSSNVDIIADNNINTYFTSNNKNTSNAGKHDLFFFLESQREAIDIDVFDEKMYYSFSFELAKLENNMQGYNDTKEFIGNLGTLINNESLLFTPKIHLPFETFDKQFFTLSIGLGIGLIHSKGTAKEITTLINDNYIEGEIYEWDETLFGVTKNLGLSYSVFFRQNDSV